MTSQSRVDEHKTVGTFMSVSSSVLETHVYEPAASAQCLQTFLAATRDAVSHACMHTVPCTRSHDVSTPTVYSVAIAVRRVHVHSFMFNNVCWRLGIKDQICMD